MGNLLSKMIRIFSGKVDFSASGNVLLYSTVERLNRLSPARPQQNEGFLNLMQQDFILGDLMPIALAIIAVKKSASQSYMFSDEFQQLCDQAAEDMANAHIQASTTLTQLLPRLPGITMTWGHEKPEALNIASSAIINVLALVSVDRALLAEDVAVSNLCEHIGEKLKINRFDAKRLYEQV